MGSPIPPMLEALELEAATIRKKGGGAQVELRGGEFVGQTDGSWLYRFMVAEEVNLRDDTPVRVTFDQEDVSGILVSFREGVMLVALEKDLGPKIPSARLVSNDAFLIERLIDRLKKVESGEIRFSRDSADRVLGLKALTSDDAEPDPTVIQDNALNPDQMTAIRRSLGSDTTFVWGPPGTGKTTTLARIIEAHYRAGRSVLLVSNTNIAVDTALERIAERLTGETDFHQGLVIRQGPVVKDELRKRFGPQVILEEIVARLGESLTKERDLLQSEARPLQAEERILKTALKDYEQLASVKRTLEQRTAARDSAQLTLNKREYEAAEHRKRASKLVADLTRAQDMNAVKRLFSGLNPERLRKEKAVADRHVQTAQAAAQSVRSDIAKHEVEISELQVEIVSLSRATEGHPPEKQLSDRLAEIQKRVAQINERVSTIDRELGQLEAEALANCRILATTVYRTYLGIAVTRQFDVVVVDEASMLMPPLVYFAAGLSTKSVTIAGDFRQLPPIVMSDEQPTQEWLKCDVFEKAGIPKRLAAKEPIPYLVALRIQYRMREPICAVVNDLFYHDWPLRSDPSVNRAGPSFPLGKSPLLYVNTGSLNPWTALRAGSFSRYNLLHALLVRNIILHLADEGYLPPAGEPNDAIGAVAPYSAQSRLIQALVNDRLGDRSVGISATVHRFQGNEKRAMILELTDSLGARLGKFMKATSLEEDGARLLNVAASRAKHHVVLVGNFDFLRSKAPERSYIRQLIGHFEKDGNELDLKAVLPLAEADWIDGLYRVLPPTFEMPRGAAGIFTEGTFYSAFAADLSNAKKSILLLSPFATSNGTARWADAFRTACSRGVSVRIMTRPPEEWGGGGESEVSNLIQGLRKLGVAVDLRSKMHEKVVIIDDRILWHGSLNILSHRDTQESMMRVESPAACQQLGRFMSVPTSSKDDERSSTAAVGNPECPECGGHTVWKDGRFGIYFECEDGDCGGKVDLLRRSRGLEGGTANSGRTGQRCPKGCGGHLQRKTGRRGPFLSCSNYPRCKYSRDLP